MASDRTQRQIDRLLDEAEEAFSRDDWHLVSDRARRALLLDPENRDATNFLSAAERALEDPIASSTPPQFLSTQPMAPAVSERTSFANGRLT